jgi:rare lipoprotein A
MERFQAPFSTAAALTAVFLAIGLALTGCASPRPIAAPAPATGGSIQTGAASYYGEAFDGRKTASGERFDMWDLTAAHPKLAMGTRVRVTNLANGRAVIVRINDRGPYHGGRIIDVSYGAAQKLGMIDAGVVRVRVEVLLR